MMELTATQRATRSRFYRLVGLRDPEKRVTRHAAGIFTEDQWGDWKGVVHSELTGRLGEEVVVWTPDGESRCVIEDIANGQTLLVGRGPAPF